MSVEDRVARWVAGELDEAEEEELFAEAADDPALLAALEAASAEALGRLDDGPLPEVPDGFVDETVLRALERRSREEAAPAWRQLARGRPAVLRLRPLGVAVALAAAAAVGLWLRAPVEERPAAPAPTTVAQTAVRLVLSTEGARSVAVAGDFNDWATDTLFLEDPEGDGVFVGTVELPPGSYGYMFVVDGEEWVTDPYAVTHRDDGFGNRNAVLRVD